MINTKKTVLLICLLFSCFFFTISVNAEEVFCTEAKVLSGEIEITDTKEVNHLYIDYNSTVTLSGEIKANGDVYVFGTLIINRGAKLSVEGTLYCLKYNSMLSAGDYDYGIIESSGSISSNNMVVRNTFLSKTIPTIKHKNIVYLDAVPATKDSTGLTAGSYCSVCGAVLMKQQVIPKKENSGQEISNQNKKVQSVVVKASKKTIKASKLKKKAQTVKSIIVKSAQGTVSYKITGGNKKSKKALKINSKTGKITVKKKAKKGAYKVKVTVTASGNEIYNAGSKTVTVIIKVK